MKNIILMVVVFLTLNACARDTHCIIKGKSSRKYLENIELFKIVNGSLVSHSKTEIDADGNFAFMLIPEAEGFYYLGNKRDYNRIYLKKGDKVNLEIVDKGYKLVRKNTKENNVLFTWYEISKEAEEKSVKFWKYMSDYTDFFPLLEKLDVKTKAFASTIKTGNEFFDKLMKLTVNWDLEYYALKFLYTPRVKHPTTDDLIAYYKNITKVEKFDNELLLWNPYAMSLIGSYNMHESFNIKKEKPQRGIAGIKSVLDKIDNAIIKGEYVLESCKRLKTYGEFCEIRNAFGKYLITDSQKERFHKFELALRTFAEGEKVINFTYPDKNGKDVSLTDFKGKLVLVDVWATWCGPCKKQIPHLEKLEKAYHGKDIVFISVSVDKEKEKWLKMIKEKNLGGVQLWANGWSQICKDYDISGVPRFMLFDKEANIISINAPRPSDPKLKELIDKYL